jgi:hypothetical protein
MESMHHSMESIWIIPGRVKYCINVLATKRGRTTHDVGDSAVPSWYSENNIELSHCPGLDIAV